MPSERREDMDERFERFYREICRRGGFRWTPAERATQFHHFLIYSTSAVESLFEYDVDRTKELVRRYVQQEEKIELKYHIDDASARERAVHDGKWFPTERFERIFRAVNGIKSPPWDAAERMERMKLFLVFVESDHCVPRAKSVDDLTVGLVVNYVEIEHDMKNLLGEAKIYHDMDEDYSYLDDQVDEDHWDRSARFRFLYANFSLYGLEDDELREEFQSFCDWSHHQQEFAGKPVFLEDITRTLVDKYIDYKKAIEERLDAVDDPEPPRNVEEIEAPPENKLGQDGIPVLEDKAEKAQPAAAVVEEAHGVKRGLPVEESGDENQRPVEGKRLFPRH